MYTVKVPSDNYHSRVNQLKEEYKEFGIEPPKVEAVDMNGKFVPMNKSDEDFNLEKSAKCAIDRLGKGGI